MLSFVGDFSILLLNFFHFMRTFAGYYLNWGGIFHFSLPKGYI